MYIPKIYKSENLELMKKIISENAFAMLISSKEKIRATHSMFLLKETDENFYLETHISKANPQAKFLENGDEVFCDFLGAHSYISSSWYQKANVSTWNYEAVQIYGKVEIMNDDELFTHLDNLTTKYESPQKCPMLISKMDENFVRKEMKGAFGIKILPTEIYIAEKLSQNRNDEDYQNIIKELQNSRDVNSVKIAEEMEKLRGF